MDSSPRLNVAAMASRSRSVSVILGLTLATTFLLACVASPIQAAITWTGNVDPSDPTSWTNSTYGIVGKSSTGEITVDDAGILSSRYGYVGYESGVTGKVTVTGNGSKWTNSNSLYVGHSGTGTLTIEAGGQVSNAYSGYIGYNSGSIGSVIVTGPGSKWTNSYSLYLGYYGTGRLTIEAGGQVSNSYGYLGYNSGSSSSVTVTGSGSKWTNSGSLFVGDNGGGTLTVSDGGTVVVGGGIYTSFSNLLGNGTISANGGILDVDLVFDSNHGLKKSYSFGSGGTLTITQSSGVLGVGYQGTGTLRIADGVAVTSSEGFLGYKVGSTGTAVVTGSGSSWTNSGTLHVGNSGTGTLTIEAGGQVSNTFGSLADNSDSTGSVTVTGSGSTWTNSSSLCVGNSGTGILTIEAGGQVSNAYSGYIGYNSGSSSSVTVTGSGSKWTNSGNLYVRDNGGGTLTVSDGGTVVVGGGIYTSFSNLLGNGTISANGGILDVDLVFDSNHGLKKSYSFGSGGTLTITQSSGVLGVGYLGTGTLQIADGVGVTSSGGYLGYKAGSTGTAVVTGNDSKWTNSGTLHVGNSGTGTLTIKAGGQVSSPVGYLGENLGSVGTVTVTGSNSKWTNNTRLYVGYYGAGTLNIGSGIASDGVVVALDVILAYASPKGICNLNGGTLQVRTISRKDGSATFNWSDGTIRNFDANTDLAISSEYSITLKLAAMGTHAFYIDAGRTGSVSAVLSDATNGGTLTKLGEGKLTLSGANTYTGQTTISAGTLTLAGAGSLASALISVQSGATFDVSAKSNYSLAANKTLTGSGTVVGNLSVSGIHAPGDSTGIETVKGNYSLLGQLQIELAGTTAGSGYDEVLQSGTSAYTTTLSGTLSLDWTGFGGSSDSTQFWILKNDTTGVLSGTFSNYANGESLGMYDGRSWYLYYGADAATGSLTGGNDVVISAVPEPATIVLLTMLAMGLGAVGWRRRK